MRQDRMFHPIRPCLQDAKVCISFCKKYRLLPFGIDDFQRRNFFKGMNKASALKPWLPGSVTEEGGNPFQFHTVDQYLRVGGNDQLRTVFSGYLLNPIKHSALQEDVHMAVRLIN